MPAAVPHAILFDLDGTLHDRAATVRAWLAEHVARFELPERYAGRFVELDDHGYRSKTLVMPQLVKELALAHDPQALFEDFWTHMNHAVPMSHAHDVLRALRSRGVRLGIVTNGWEAVQQACLARCGLSDLVDDVVISKVVGFSKPDPRIYQLALERLRVGAADAWFVGDSPRNDIWGPQAVGLRAAYLPTGHGLGGEVPEVVLGDLRGVLGLG
ncbi:HAD-IA family hydrolase [Deinococcus sp. HMF7620]|uniref:HAD-IA family hydrolase n=1 Tax=Deinococcus arboris TaxID=2682977 RepID=A0A7C9I9X1_9DEIO|nr:MULTISPECIES: HAD family hydrolase [Deinococcus]MBZ9751974.1 HAD family hydrolase [Deinococcus betulae]MVN86466.1 HAD-IA family hydrolase [Deinococcus arboris]